MSILGRSVPATGTGTAVSDLDLWYAAQLRAVGVLADLLVMAGDAALLPAIWTVRLRGGLSGSCSGLTDDELRASFEAWLKLLGAERLPGDVSMTGGVILRGRVEIRGCEVRLSAHLLARAGGED